MYTSFPTKRAQHILETESTDAQSATEDECAAFFVDLPSLSKGELDHLRNVGLLPPLPVGKGGGVTRNKVDGKAAKLLGLETESVDDGPRIELLEEEEEDSSPSSLHAENGNGNVDQNGNVGGGSDDDGRQPFDPYAIQLLRKAHAKYLTKALSNPLPRGFVSLDASHPWMTYWCLHSLDVLGYFDIDAKKRNTGLDFGDDALKEVEVLQKGHLLKRIVSTLDHCWSDVPLEFDGKEVANDFRLKQLSDEQAAKSNNDAKLPPGGKVSITGGGFGGGPQQMPHCAVTYAAVLALCIVSSVGLAQSNGHPYHKAGKLAMDLLTKRRLQLYAFFLTLREKENSDGEEERIAFRMQHDGEIDVRASYCILAPCLLLGLLDKNEDLKSNIANPLQSPSISRHIASCQTYEGGFGAEPFNEAHGGYTFCALAALRILDSVSVIDVNSLASWLAGKQMGFEGGFCGRTNKLVDGCYSFWQGGAVAVLDGWLNSNDHDSLNEGSGMENMNDNNELSFDEVMLQRYILLCAQDVNGGLRDKPSKPKDFYHSCYNLSGLSVAQHALKSWPPSNNTSSSSGNEKMDCDDFNRFFGDTKVNAVGKTDPVVNIRVERIEFMLAQRF